MSDDINRFLQAARGVCGLDGVFVSHLGGGPAYFPVVDYSPEGIRAWESCKGLDVIDDEPTRTIEVARTPSDPRLERILREGGLDLRRP